MASVAFAQDEETAPADSLMAAQGDTLETREHYQAVAVPKEDEGKSFITKFDNTPKAGIRTNVTSTMYYGDFTNSIGMSHSSTMTNKLGYSWAEFRQQIKTSEKRDVSSSYNTGLMLPFMATLQASRNWKQDLTTNAAGRDNVSKRDYKTGGLMLSKPKLILGGFNFTLKSSAGANDQQAVNQSQRNDVSENYLDGGMQVGTQVFDGVSVAGRVFGRTTGGDRSLGDMTAPSSSRADSVGVGVYYDRNFSSGRIALTRGNFDREFLDYKRDDLGLIDTIAGGGMDNVVDEMEIKDALTMELINETRLMGVNFETKLSHKMNESDFAVSRVGYKEKLEQKADFAMSFTAGRDTFFAGYEYKWKWDDQLTKGSTISRGKQYRKERALKLYWQRTLFKATKMTMRMGSGISQDTAENGYVSTDKDNLRYDFSVRLERNWPQKFQATMIFAFKEDQSLALDSNKSANNNFKDSYEIAPGYSWPLSPWLTFSQSYRIYIQYTDYLYSQLENSNRADNYNKRGNLTTNVKIKAGKRLEINVKYDYNKRFNADKTNEGTTGSSEYFVSQRQKINKIDLSFVFKVANGVTLEGSTYSTKDEKTTVSTVDKVAERLEGKIWVGTRVNRKWGTNNPITLSAMVKKHNGYGPSISEASSDYWESDIWLKWEF